VGDRASFPQKTVKIENTGFGLASSTVTKKKSFITMTPLKKLGVLLLYLNPLLIG
jgi:hypothetical protein